MIDFFPFLMGLEDVDQPVERTWDHDGRNKVAQSAIPPAVERWQEDRLGLLYCNSVILTQSFRFDLAALLAGPRRRLEEVPIAHF